MSAVKKAPTKETRWYVYLARCGDGSLYTGTAVDVKARIAQHEAGKGARYTRGRAPISLAASVVCGSRGDALRVELAVKALSRAQKLALVALPKALARLVDSVREKHSRSTVRPTTSSRKSSPKRLKTRARSATVRALSPL